MAQIERHHTPRLNVAALVLEADDNRPLVEAFVASMGIVTPSRWPTRRQSPARAPLPVSTTCPAW